MQPEQCQDKQHADPVAPREPAWRRSLVAFRHMLNIGNVTLLQDMIWIHSCETLLLDWVYSVRNTFECSGIPDEEGETGVAGFEREVLQRNRKKMAQKEGGERQPHRRGAVSNSSRSFLSDMTFSNHHGKAGVAKRGACIPKTTEAKYLPDIRHILGSGSLLQIVKV